MHALALYMYDTGWTLDIGQSICGEECNTISGVPSVRWIRTRDNAASLQAKKPRMNPSQGGQSEHSMAEEPSADSAVPVTHLRLIVNYRSYTPIRPAWPMTACRSWSNTWDRLFICQARSCPTVATRKLGYGLTRREGYWSEIESGNRLRG